MCIRDSTRHILSGGDVPEAGLHAGQRGAELQGHKLFHAVRPFISALAVIATAAILVFTIYFTQLGPQWITFLTGILVAAILAEATRRSHAEWVVTRRTAQLSSIKIKLEREAQLRKTAEKEIAASKSRLHL